MLFSDTVQNLHQFNSDTYPVAALLIFFSTNPLTVGVVWAPQMTSQPVSSIFVSVLRCPFGLGILQACPFPDFVFPPLLMSALSFPPFHCASQNGFGQTDERETCAYRFSVGLFTMVGRSSCGPIACWIFAQTSSLLWLQTSN